MDRQCQHLSPNEQERILHIMIKYESLFDRKLGTWKNAPVDLELKYDATPVCSRPYPLLRVNEAMFRKEVERLVKLGVLKEANDSEWVSPSFAKPKPKMNNASLLSDFRNLNTQLKRKTYPMPKIREKLLKLEGFQ